MGRSLSLQLFKCTISGNKTPRKRLWGVFLLVTVVSYFFVKKFPARILLSINLQSAREVGLHTQWQRPFQAPRDLPAIFWCWIHDYRNFLKGCISLISFKQIQPINKRHIYIRNITHGIFDRINKYASQLQRRGEAILRKTSGRKRVGPYTIYLKPGL